MSIKIGIDLGGTKIEVIALTEQGEPLFRQRTPTPQGDYNATVNCIAELVTAAEQACQDHAEAIGVGIPGAISPATGLIKNANSTCLIGQRLDDDLEKLLKRPIRLANDADCFALSEAIDGSAAGYNSVFGVILGTGVGAGIVINKTLLSGPNAICGEWGHNPLPWPVPSDNLQRACYCGKQDCIETFLSGPGFSSALPSNTGLTSLAIWQRARAGDRSCQTHCDLYIEQLSKALASIINVLDPSVIVLGGGLSNIDEIYEQLPKRLATYLFSASHHSDPVLTPIVKAKYGDSSGVRGAAWL